MPEWRCSWLYQRKNRPQKAWASWKLPNRSGNSGRYFMVRNWLSEYGLSLEQCGRECDLLTPRLASRNATGLAVLGEPRSAWMVSCPKAMPCLAAVSASRALARRAFSAWASIQPGTYRL